MQPQALGANGFVPIHISSQSERRSTSFRSTTSNRLSQSLLTATASNSLKINDIAALLSTLPGPVRPKSLPAPKDDRAIAR